MGLAPPPPSSGNGSLPLLQQQYSSSHAVCRSAEFLSCAKTAIKIAQRQRQQQQQNGGAAADEVGWWSVALSDLKLHPYHHTATSSNSTTTNANNKNADSFFLLSQDERQERQSQGLLTTTPTDEILQDGLAVLRTMQSELQQLELLVRRRGHVNDPTLEISASVQRLERDTKELAAWMQTMIPVKVRAAGVNSHAYKHWMQLQSWFQQAAQVQGAKLQAILKVRGKVLAEQAQRRKQFQASSSANTTSTTSTSTATAASSSILAPPTAAAAAANRFDNPLFQIQPPTRPQAPPLPSSSSSSSSSPAAAATTANGNDSLAAFSKPAPPLPLQPASWNGNGNAGATSAAVDTNHATPSGHNPYSARNGGTLLQPSSRYGMGSTAAAPRTSTRLSSGYGGSSSTSLGYGGYGGASTSSSSSGIRQRKHTVQSSLQQDQHQNQEQLLQAQILARQQERQTQLRLQEARQAESSLVELSSMFGKMSSLITQQAEVIDKVEDDVEAALLDVTAGQQEINTLYSIKKGNRALIIKVFALLIFFIIFMRLYAR